MNLLHKNEIMPRLMETFQFTPEDLEANRQGQISETQYYKLRELRASVVKGFFWLGVFAGAFISVVSILESALTPKGVALFIGLVFVMALASTAILEKIFGKAFKEIEQEHLALTVIVFSFPPTYLWTWLMSPYLATTLLIQGGGLLLGIGAAALAYAYEYYYRGQDLRLGEVLCASGGAVLDIQTHSESSPSYFITVEKRKFEISKEQFLALQNRMPYHLYYLPTSKKALSIEPIPIVEVVSLSRFEQIEANAVVKS